MRKATGSLILLWALSCPPLHAQIWGGEWFSSTSAGPGTSCTDDQVDADAICQVTAYCTSPPDPVAEILALAAVNDRCDNQPVENLVTIGQIDNMTEHLYTHSEGLAWGRTIHTEVKTGDCNGVTRLISTFTDPNGCAPPPPPPPPPCTGCGGCQGCRPPGCSSPVVIDVLDEGMHFTNLLNGVQFDLNGDGKPLYLSWTDPNYHNAWLALDRNHTGTIDSAQELFGYLTEPQVPSPDGQRTGWLALAVYDDPRTGATAMA